MLWAKDKRNIGDNSYWRYERVAWKGIQENCQLRSMFKVTMESGILGIWTPLCDVNWDPGMNERMESGVLAQQQRLSCIDLRNEHFKIFVTRLIRLSRSQIHGTP
jgi:hypothetical protein